MIQMQTLCRFGKAIKLCIAKVVGEYFPHIEEHSEFYETLQPLSAQDIREMQQEFERQTIV